MNDIWVPMDAGVIVVTLKERNELEIQDQMAMEKRPVSAEVGFSAYRPRPPKKPPKK